MDHVPNECQCFKAYYLKVVFMALFTVLCPVHLASLGVTMVFDTVCLVKDGTSLVNCSQNIGIIDKPQPFVILFYLTNVINAALLLTTLHFKPPGIEFCGFRNALKKLAKKGSFWSLNITLILVIVEYIIASCQCTQDALCLAIIIAQIIFHCSRLIVAYFINYLLPVQYPIGDERSWIRIYTWLAYWITLIMFWLDTAHFVLAVTLDVAEKVTLLGNVTLGSHDSTVVARLVLIGVQATFEARLFLFYWNKLFHGDKDLFSSLAILQSIREEQHLIIHNP